MRINAFTTKSGRRAELTNLTVLVGPNNVGKSRTLKDLHMRFRDGEKARTTIVDKIEIDFPDRFEELTRGLEFFDEPNNVDVRVARGIGSNLISGDQQQINVDHVRQRFEDEEWREQNIDWFVRQFGKFRVAHLDAASRLNIASAASPRSLDEGAPERLIQTLLHDLEMQDKLNEAFQDIFERQIKLDYSALSQLKFRVATEFPEIPDHPVRAKPIMERFSVLDDQGDGFRSLTAVLLSLLASRDRIMLIDEPEAFLHPFQARKLGNWIGKLCEQSDSQVIVATHNANLLAGILASGADTDVFRLNRSEDDTRYRRIASEHLEGLSGSPLLSNQRVLDAVFHRGSVVCEADSDKLYYQGVAARLDHHHEVQFLHAHNKQTIYKVIELLVAADIPCAAIPDLDLFNSETDVKRLIESFGEVCDQSLLDARSEVALSVEGESDEDALKDLVSDLKDLMGQLESGEHTLSGARSALRRIDASASKWRPIKLGGEAAFLEDVKPMVERLISELKMVGVFVVPVGELESWSDLGTRRKSKWIVQALVELKENGPPQEVTDFVTEVIQYVQNAA